MMMDNNAVDLFKANWALYQKVVQRDYMLHAHFSTLIREHLFNEKEQLRVLDLGCGDASQILPLLMELPVSRYTGFDLSEAALAIAAENLTSLKGEVVLLQGPMEDLITQEQAGYDIIFSSYAIHHLQDGQKRALIGRIASLLNGGGKFIWIDVFRADGQSRDQYLDAYLGMIASNWTALTAAELGLITEHVRNYDYPSEKTRAIQWLQEAGFSIQISDSTDPFHKIYILGRDQRS